MTPRKPTPADVPRYVTDAREHLVDLRRAVNQITDEDLYDRSGQTETPDRTPKRVSSPSLWEPSKRGIHADWQRAWRHVGDASRILRDDADVPFAWVHPVADREPDGGRSAAYDAFTVNHREAHVAVIRLLSALDHVDSSSLPPPYANAVLRACDEIRAARETLAGHLDRTPPADDPEPPACANDGCSRDARRREDGRYKPECSACERYRQRYGKPREVAA